MVRNRWKILESKNSERFSPFKNNLIINENSKHQRFDKEKNRYALIKEFSNLKTGVVNKYTKMNEIKLNESERKKVFKRLIDDSNRRMIERNKIIEEEKINKEDINQNDEKKKYNKMEWNKVYDERFKEYEEYKKKKMEIKKAIEKIEKLIEEEEEQININQKINKY